MDAHTTIVAAENQVSVNLQDETVILNLKSGVYFGLNAVGAFIWERMKQPVQVIALRDAVLAEYDVDAECCERDVLSILEKLHQAGLIETVDVRA